MQSGWSPKPKPQTLKTHSLLRMHLLEVVAIPKGQKLQVTELVS